MAGDDEVMFRFVRGEPDQEEVAAVMAALSRTFVIRPRDGDAPAPPPSWGEPGVFEAPNSWSSR
ncbi:acyl-CoA carboxylase subunit epsilon [Streptosporangium sp. NPDC002721]|uniref:acyl-CoA carboxylase subunit epsilon n=1 Tax=Streptosporangium sp. NPDC002721 TaxID=3366188 RepID=UPI0036C4D952